MAPTDYHFYKYKPSLAAAITTIVVFTILLLLHLFRLFKTRTWFCIPFAIGAACEIIGFSARAYGHPNDAYDKSVPGPLIAFIIQAALILIAPLFYAASVYMFLGRIIRSTPYASLSRIKPRNVTRLFVIGDLVCLSVQSTGSSMLTNADGNQKQRDLGNWVVIAGLVIQIIIFGFFVYVAGIWHSRVRSAPGYKNVKNAKWDWEMYLKQLYVVSGTITARNLFRVVEYIMGEDGYLMVKEWPTYVLDALPMAIVVGICVQWYVGHVEYAQLASQTGRDPENIEMMANGRSGESTGRW